MQRRIAFALMIVIALSLDALAQKPDPDVQKVLDQYAAAFNRGDAKGVAALYMTNALRVGPDGQLQVGRTAIEETYTGTLSGSPGKLVILPGRTQMITADVRVIEGTYELTGGGGNPVRGRYVNTIVRDGSQWRLASVVALPQ